MDTATVTATITRSAVHKAPPVLAGVFLFVGAGSI